jgi:hypothetical protein
MAKIDNFFNDEKFIKKISDEIAEMFETESNAQNIDYNFDIEKGTGRVKSRESNTLFYFDAKEGTNLNEFKKALFDEDLSYIEQNSEDEKELMRKVRYFLKEVSDQLNYNHVVNIRNKIRDIVLPSSKEEDIPLSEITIISIDVADFSSVPESSKYTLRIGKVPDTTIDTAAVTMAIQDIQEETGKTFEEILQTEKENNPLFKNVMVIERGKKYLYDINITLFVDYSLSSLPPESEVLNKN